MPLQYFAKCPGCSSEHKVRKSSTKETDPKTGHLLITRWEGFKCPKTFRFRRALWTVDQVTQQPVGKVNFFGHSFQAY